MFCCFVDKALLSRPQAIHGSFHGVTISGQKMEKLNIRGAHQRHQDGTMHEGGKGETKFNKDGKIFVFVLIVTGKIVRSMAEPKTHSFWVSPWPAARSPPKIPVGLNLHLLRLL